MLCGFSDQFLREKWQPPSKDSRNSRPIRKKTWNCCSNNQCYKPKPSSLPQLGKLLLLDLLHSHYRPAGSKLLACSQADGLLWTMEGRQYISERTSGLWPERDTFRGRRGKEAWWVIFSWDNASITRQSQRSQLKLSIEWDIRIGIILGLWRILKNASLLRREDSSSMYSVFSTKAKSETQPEKERGQVYARMKGMLWEPDPLLGNVDTA